MNKWQKINVFLFVFFCIAVISFAYFIGSDFLQKQEKPWHMQSAVHEDSLSANYRKTYLIWNSRPIIQQMATKKETSVLILVDGWGVPIDESKLKNEFETFETLPHIFALHQRLANRTKHAELVEYKNAVHEAMFLFGGDSLEYSRKDYMLRLGFKDQLYCQHCSDSAMLVLLDSLLSDSKYKTIAWTTQDFRYGDDAKLIKLLNSVANIAKKHPDIQFAVQGTHRPILDSPEKRREYYSHWVPVVIIEANSNFPNL